ncbi:hypothetical protein VNO77_27840 [Canavalia gladiata]|uniref:Uncharacterized protein n=1 Tax=Canavalia gladiata TaxID=3824 RepID=A0AAN9KXM3_CANGL
MGSDRKSKRSTESQDEKKSKRHRTEEDEEKKERKREKKEKRKEKKSHKHSRGKSDKGETVSQSHSFSSSVTEIRGSNLSDLNSFRLTSWASGLGMTRGFLLNMSTLRWCNIFIK